MSRTIPCGLREFVVDDQGCTPGPVTEAERAYLAAFGVRVRPKKKPARDKESPSSS